MRKPKSTRVPGRADAGLAAWRWLYWVLPAALAFALFVPSVWMGRVWDDSIVFEQHVPALQSVHDLFVPPARIPQWQYSFYRPVLMATYLLDAALYGAEASAGPHFTGLILHVLATILVALLAARLLGGFPHGRRGALFAGLFFAVHPIHSESVHWISGRSDPLATVLLLAALWAAACYRCYGRKWGLWTSPLLFLMALLAKEVAAVGFILLPLYWLALPAQGWASETGASAHRSDRSVASRPLARILVLYGLALVVYALLRRVAGAGFGAQRWWPAGGAAEILRASASAFGYYGVKLVFPPPQNILVVGTAGVVGTVIVGLALVLALLFAARKVRQGERVWLLSLSWVVLGLLPALPVAFSRLAEAPVAERYLYLPSVGLCWLLGTLLALHQPDRRMDRWRAAAAVALVALAAITTWSRGRVWKDDLTLWSDTVQKAPSAGLAWTELGNSYLRTSQAPAQALEAFKRAVSADNDPLGRAIAYNSMGVVYARLGEEAEARKAWNAAVAEGAGYATAPYNLANHLAQQFERRARGGQDADVSLLEEARSHLNRAVELDPRYEKAWLRLVWCDVYRGIGLLASGNRPAALAELATARQDRQRFQEQLPASPLLREADRLIAHGESQLARGSGGSAGPPIRGQGR